ncbi:MAG: sigma-70 family RNA polymerase sigma factor [Bacteroidota bacterium]
MAVEVSELTFISRLRAGDRAAFNELVTRYQSGVINVCFGFTKNQEEAEDVAQEVFIEVYRNLAQFKEESGLYTWIYRIAVSKSLDFLRSKNRKKRAAFFKNRSRGEAAELALLQVADHGRSADEQLEQKRMQIAIEQAISRLPETQRIAFTLTQVEELSYKEVTAILDKSQSSVESLVHRAKQNLRKLLKKEFERLTE